jgi:hypothetical protein
MADQGKGMKTSSEGLDMPVKPVPLNLPRLLYIGDIPIGSTIASSALIYRLLADYPRDRLWIMESNLMPQSPAETKLPGVPHEIYFSGIHRLLRTRWTTTYGRFLYHRAAGRGRRIARRFARATWQPQAILTIAHGHGWLIAAAAARKLRVPLHLIVHDDVFPNMFLSADMKPAFDKRFGDVYRFASSRLCVSPFMAEEYERLYGKKGDVIYPCRPRKGPEFSEPSARTISTHQSKLNFAYAGSLFIRGYTELLGALAKVLAVRGHTLTVFSSLDAQSARQFGLEGAHVSLRAMVPRNELIPLLNKEADVLFAPMSFDPVDRSNMEVCFLSKLTDYTASGLPLLFCGPEYGSAMKWAKENPGVAECIEQPDDLDGAVQRLEDATYRHRLAEAAIAAGKTYFAYEPVSGNFFRNLCKDQTE